MKNATAMKITTTLIRNSVMVRVLITNDVRKFINTGVKIDSRTEWNKGAVVNRPDAVELNAIIGSKVTEVKRVVTALEAQGIAVTPENITEAITNKQASGSFLDYMEKRIEDRRLQPNTTRNHLISLEALRRFGRINSFASLTTENIMLFDRFLREEDPERSQSTIRGYHARIKPYVTEAVLMRKVKENPYNHFAVPRGSSAVRNPLTETEIRRVADARLPKIYHKAQDIFIFQAYTGLAYADAMAFDAREQVVIRDGKTFISNKRTKTGTPFYTPMLPDAEAVLLKYGDRLPRLSNQKYNMHLHAIEGIVRLDKPLTSHVARHSFATLMLSHDIPIAVVSRMLGHTDINVTQIYAKITNDKIEQSVGHLWNDLE